MNVELLQQIKAQILAEPDAFRMDTWSCGTAHCIAGWALQLNGLKIANVSAGPHQQRLVDGRRPSAVAATLLGIPKDSDSDGWDDIWDSPADRLFDTNSWPSRFELAYDEAGSRADRAQVAADRIDHFIATEGRE